jgi:hypothetical protein
MSVPAPLDIAPTATVDTVQDLVTRRREARQNRLRYHLTETDCVLLCTHGVDKYYQHGQVIAQEGQPIRAVYRIKSGRICLQKQGQRLYNLAPVYLKHSPLSHSPPTLLSCLPLSPTLPPPNTL